RDVRTGECRAKLQPCGITFTPSVLSRKTWIVGPFFGSPSHLGIAVLIIPSGSFFHAQTNVSVDIKEELSPNVRMSRKRGPPLFSSCLSHPWCGTVSLHSSIQ